MGSATAVNNTTSSVGSLNVLLTAVKTTSWLGYLTQWAPLQLSTPPLDLAATPNALLYSCQHHLLARLPYPVSSSTAVKTASWLGCHIQRAPLQMLTSPPGSAASLKVLLYPPGPGSANSLNLAVMIIPSQPPWVSESGQASRSSTSKKRPPRGENGASWWAFYKNYYDFNFNYYCYYYYKFLVHLTSFLLGAFSFNTSCMLCKPNIELCIIERLTFSVVPKLIFCTRGQVPYATTINQLILPMAALGFAIGQFIREERNAGVGNSALCISFSHNRPLSPPPHHSCPGCFGFQSPDRPVRCSCPIVDLFWLSCSLFSFSGGSVFTTLFNSLFWRPCSVCHVLIDLNRYRLSCSGWILAILFSPHGIPCRQTTGIP